jgi:hypothetical protein
MKKLEEELDDLKKVEAGAGPETDISAVRAKIRQVEQLLAIQKAHENPSQPVSYRHAWVENPTSRPMTKREAMARLKDRLAKLRGTLLAEIASIEAELRKVDQMPPESFEEPKSALDAITKAHKDPRFCV